jgi:5-hydroxyisourate hydrolase-like protein (transthyretin family)
MRSRRTADRCVRAGALVAIVMAFSADRAAAGEFAVGSCKADQLNYSTRAFEEFATRGMSIRRACDPEGTGLRGLITRNVVRESPVARRSVALVTISAPAGTRFTTFRWAGELKRTDCRYALQMWADAPDMQPIPIKNVRANRGCPRPRRVQTSGYVSENFVVTNATRIVQRVICVGRERRKFCSARGLNYILTDEAEVGIADVVAPMVAILGDTPLARGEWVGGTQPLSYDASDNVGVRMAKAIGSGNEGGFEDRPCAFATPEGSFAAQVPCPNGRGRITVDTKRFAEGTQALVVQAHDTAGNVADSLPVTARIDNSPPGRVDVGVDGGQAWRNTSDFALAWANPPEPDRAPITAASYQLCPVGPGTCKTNEQQGGDISRLAVQVPAPGEWTLSLWRRDAAGNQTETAASVPVTLRYDPEPPQLAFEPPSSDDPTLVVVSVTDKVSGLAGGAIEISPTGSGAWQALPTDKDGNRLLARIDDAALAAGGYQLRARAFDQANNEASTDRRLDGQPMAVSLPLRIVARMRAGFERVRTVRRAIQRHGRRRVVRRRVIVLEPAGRVRSGGHARVAGRLVNRDGQGIAGAEVRVLSSSSVNPEQLIAGLQTDRDGRFRYRAAGSTSRTLRFAYAGSPLILPAERTIEMRVPAQTSLRVNRSRVLNGQSVTFSGRLRTQPAPASGKLIELQVRLSDRWQTFRTSRTDGTGRWAIRYRFKRTRGVQRFRFRARLPHEASYPFAPGRSNSLTVRVRGL